MKNVLCIAKYSHDFTYFKNIKNYAESGKFPAIKIDVIINLPIFIVELFSFLLPVKLTKAEISECLIAEVKRKIIKYSGLKVRFYAILFSILARLYFVKYSRILKAGNYNALFVWGGFNVGQRMAILAAKKLGIKVFHFENGLLPETTVMDTEGTNYYNSVPREYNFYKNIEPNYIKSSLVPRASKQIKGKEIILPEKFIFCPFQVALDTQILVHSPWIKSMEEFYTLLEQIAEKLDVIFVIKEHPSCFKSYHHLHNKNNPKILFANANGTEELISKSEMIITVNSTVGIEGIMHDKKVVTIGNAFYSGYGFAKKASATKELIEIIRTRESWEVNHEDNIKFLSYLQNIYLIPGTWKTPNSKHLEAIMQRLSKNI